MALNSSGLRFDAAVKYVKLGAVGSPPTIKGLANFTWMARVKVNTALNKTLMQRAYVERQGSGTGVRFACVPSKDRLRFELAVTDGQSDTNYDFIYNWDTNWHHVAFVGKVDGASPTAEIYLDGVKVFEGVLRKTGGDAVVMSNTNPVNNVTYIGAASYNKSVDPESFLEDRQWYGNIDDIMIYNTARTQVDIQDYISQRNTYGTSDVAMIAYYPFNENTGTQTTDLDNTGNKGNLYKDGATSTLLWTTDVPYIGDAVLANIGPLDTTVPNTVTGLATSAITTDGFTANWNATTDNVWVEKYEIRVSTVNTFSTQSIYTVNTAFDRSSTFSLPINDLLPNQIYYWKIVAYDARNNVSADSSVLNFTTTATGDLTAPDPPAGVATSLFTDSSFLITIVADNTPEVPTGFKIDVAYDQGFTNYVSGWRNKDNGALLTASVIGLEELTSYFVRVRQYDAFGNESTSSPYVHAATSSRPDLIAPDPVDAEPATSVDGRRFTANWEKGTDNIGVVGYRLDVSTVSNFASFVTGYNNLDIGNNLRALVSGLAENTVYYYRVRAYDAAGNTSSNAGYVNSVTTRPLSLEDGDETNILIGITDSAYTYSSAATTPQSIPNNPYRLHIHSASGVATYRAYFQFTVPADALNITSAMFYAYVQNASSGATGQFRVGLGTIDSATLTWNTQPALTNGPITFTHASINTFQAINLTPYITAPGTYLVSLETTSADDAIYWSNRYTDNTKVPYVEVEYSLSPMTKIESIGYEDEVAVRTNHCTNPNFEVAANTTGWTRVGSSGSLVNTLLEGVDGTRALRTTHNANSTTPATSFAAISTALNEYVTVTFSAKTDVPTAEFFSSGDFSTTGDRDDYITLSTEMRQYSFTYQGGAAGTFTWSLKMTQNASAVNVYIDNVCITKTGGPIGYFDGNTPGGVWSGTANLSTSSLTFTRMMVSSNYLGDSDADNSFIAAIRRQGELSWFSVPATNNTKVSVTNTAITRFPTMFPEVNLLPNPSFEINTTGWSGSGNGTISRDELYADNGSASAKVVVTVAAANSGIQSTKVFGVDSNEKVYGRAMVIADPGVEVELTLRALSSTNTNLGETTAVLGTSKKIGGGPVWLELTQQYTVPNNTKQIVMFVKFSSAAQTGTFYVDSCMIGLGDFVPPYRDGTFEDAHFIGAAHNSPTYLDILYDTNYEVLHRYTDPDGVMDFNSTVGDIAILARTSPYPILQTIVNSMTFTPTTDRVDVVVDYVGDDNDSMTALMYFKRSDSPTYQLATSYIDRNDKVINGILSNLLPGSSYDVRVDFLDSDGVYNAINDSIYGVVTTELVGAFTESPSLITFGNFVLNDETDRLNKVMVTSHDGFGFPTRRIDSEDIPRQDGGVETQAYWGKRSIRMAGIVEGVDRGDLANALDSFKRAMMPRLQPLIINSLASTGRKYFATVQSLDIDEKGGENFRHVPWSAEFLCADPFAYAIAPTIYGPITVTSNSPVLVASAGSFDTFPIITLTTTSNQRVYVDVTNETSGERITPERGIMVDDVLIIDCASTSVQMNGKELGYSGMFPRMFAGTNTFRFTFAGGPLIVTIKWIDRFL